MDRKERIEKLEKNINDCKKDLSKINEELAEAKAFLEGLKKKPERRHGDYGFGKTGTARITLNHEFQMVTAGDGCVHPYEVEEYYPNPVLGNIFDDLKALSEPLEEFEVQCRCNSGDILKVNWEPEDERIVFEIRDESVIIDDDKLSDFILKLRRLQATKNF